MSSPSMACMDLIDYFFQLHMYPCYISCVIITHNIHSKKYKYTHLITVLTLALSDTLGESPAKQRHSGLPLPAPHCILTLN